jgi:hypothetical protein
LSSAKIFFALPSSFRPACDRPASSCNAPEIFRIDSLIVIEEKRNFIHHVSRRTLCVIAVKLWLWDTRKIRAAAGLSAIGGTYLARNSTPRLSGLPAHWERERPRLHERGRETMRPIMAFLRIAYCCPRTNRTPRSQYLLASLEIHFSKIT